MKQLWGSFRLGQDCTTLSQSSQVSCLSSGFILDSCVNCDNSYEEGLTAMNTMKGRNFGDLRLKRKGIMLTQGRLKSQ